MRASPTHIHATQCSTLEYVHHVHMGSLTSAHATRIGTRTNIFFMRIHGHARVHLDSISKFVDCA